MKHAYLIMIHENNLILQRLLQLIDDPQNDIYIHIDKKSKALSNEEITPYVKHSGLYFTKRRPVYWGDNSIAKVQLDLMRCATSHGEYAYYHILSGADLPIKTQREIHDFFDAHKGKEFIQFGTSQYQQGIQERYNVYHVSYRLLGRYRDKTFWNRVETYLLALQRRLHVDRTKKYAFKVFGGANWCSITQDFVTYLLAHAHEYRKVYRFSPISDESIYQTIVMNSPFRDNLYIKEFADDKEASMRYIDWNRGNPYVFRLEDFEDLINSKYLFARKFDIRVDGDIVERIYQELNQ